MTHIELSSIILETERLRLRHQQPADIEPLMALWLDPVVTHHLGGPRDRARLRAAFEETDQDPTGEQYDLWPLIERATGQVVGHCGLLDKEVAGQTEIEVIYILAASVWGQGYATEIGQALVSYAFETMGLPRLIALIEPDNVTSEQVAMKLGMCLEREVVRPGGNIRRMYVIENPNFFGNEFQE